MSLAHLAHANLFKVTPTFPTTEMEFTDVDKAYQQAEFFTSLGFEVKVDRVEHLFFVTFEA